MEAPELRVRINLKINALNRKINVLPFFHDIMYSLLEEGVVCSSLFVAVGVRIDLKVVQVFFSKMSPIHFPLLPCFFYPLYSLPTSPHLSHSSHYPPKLLTKSDFVNPHNTFTNLPNSFFSFTPALQFVFNYCYSRILFIYL